MGDPRPDIPIPQGLQQLMQDFVVTVLREQPDDVVGMAAEYFTKLKESREEMSSGSKVNFEQPEEEDDEDMPEDEEFLRRMREKQKYGRRKSVSAEGYDPDKDDEDDDAEERIVNPKSDEQRNRLIAACQKVLLFNRLDKDQFNQVLDAMFEHVCQPGDSVINEGDDGDNFYVIESGNYDVYKVINGDNLKVASYDNKGSFGELALMYNAPRAATVSSVDGGTLWALDRQTYVRIIVRANAKKRRMYEQFLQNVHILQTLEEFERQKVADAMEPKEFEDGEIIIQQGDTKLDYFYFVMEGEVKYVLTDDDDVEKEIKRDTAGGYFGELALIQDKPRAVTVSSVGVTKCGCLDVQAFERLLGPCKEIMKRNVDLYAKELEQVSSKQPAEASSPETSN